MVEGDLDYSRSYYERLSTVTARKNSSGSSAPTSWIPAGRTAVSINPAPPPRRPPADSSSEGGQIPDFTGPRLPNGARLLLQRDPRLPNVHFRLVIGGGALFEAPDKRGATALLATLMAKDSLHHSAAEVAQRIEEVGGTFHPFSGNNSFGLAAEVLAPDAGRALSVLAEATLEPAFKPGAVTLERDAQLAALREDADDVVTEARKLLRLKFFGAHPLALDAQGDEAGVKALTRADLVALHRRLIVGGNVVLAVAGDVPRALVAKLKAFLARIAESDPSSPVPSAKADLAARRSGGDFTEKRPREQAVVLQAFPAPALAHAGFLCGRSGGRTFQRDGFAALRAGAGGEGPRLFRPLRRVTGWDAAMFSFIAGTQPGKEGEVLAEIEAEIARVGSGGVEEQELNRCRTRLKAARRQSLQTNSARAFHAGLNALQGRPVNDWKAYDARVGAVTREDLARFAGRYFQRAYRTQLVVRP